MPPEDDLLAGLNARQREAVLHAGGPLFILAGPGSGKTRVLTHRVAYRIRCGGLQPEAVMAITFTNRAAGELRERVDAILGRHARVRTGTFHWMCNGLLRKFGDRLGLRRDFSLLNPGHAREVLRQVAETAGVSVGVGSIAAAISAVKNGSSLAREARRFRISEDRVALLMERYREALRRSGALDLDDLLWESARLLRDHPGVREQCRLSISELLIDEYQDTNPVQQELVALLVPVDGSVTAVGDEDQAIYGWRQAGNGTTARFLEDFPRARVVILDESYRSTKQILRAASEMISHNPQRTPKSLRTANLAGQRPRCYVAQDEKDEAVWVVREMRKLVATCDYTWSDTAVLYRINAQSRAIEDALVREGIPYTVLSGRRFYDRPEIRSVLAFLRLALDPGDDAAMSYLLGQVSGIGPRRLGRLQEMATRRGMALREATEAEEVLGGLPSRTRTELASLLRSIKGVWEARAGSLPEVVDVAIAVVRAHLASSCADDSGSELEDLQELRSVVADLARGRTTLRELVDRMTLEDYDSDRARDGVALLSLHASKGLEFPVVFIVGLEDGLLPHRRALDSEADVEEERRLCYVGMTRARGLLYLSYAHARSVGGQMLGGAPSRFLGEMGSANVEMEFSARPTRSPRLHTVSPGDRVRHTRWQEGTVTAVEGKGRDVLVTVAFDVGGSQRMQLCHAPLTRLPAEVPGGRAG